MNWLRFVVKEKIKDIILAGVVLWKLGWWNLAQESGTESILLGVRPLFYEWPELIEYNQLSLLPSAFFIARYGGEWRTEVKELSKSRAMLYVMCCQAWEPIPLLHVNICVSFLDGRFWQYAYVLLITSVYSIAD